MTSYRISHQMKFPKMVKLDSSHVSSSLITHRSLLTLTDIIQ